jgi:hypothetical protein
MVTLFLVLSILSLAVLILAIKFINDDVLQLSMTILSICCVIIFGVLSFAWHHTEKQAEFVNRNFGKNYTVEEVFYNSELIKFSLIGSGTKLDSVLKK